MKILNDAGIKLCLDFLEARRNRWCLAKTEASTGPYIVLMLGKIHRSCIGFFGGWVLTEGVTWIAFLILSSADGTDSFFWCTEF